MKTSDAAVSAVRFEARMWREASTGTQEVRNPETGVWSDVPTAHPAEWAVYATDSSVRMDYASSEEEARAVAAKWNGGKVPALVQAKAESVADLRKLLQPGDTVSTILRSVSRSGMSRRISLVIARENEVVDITWDAARAMGDNVKQGGKYVQDAGMVVNGCGMDMGWNLVYNLSATLFPDGFAPSEVGIRPADGKRVNVNIGRGKDAGPMTHAEMNVFMLKGWSFPGGRNGNASGWDNNGGYALKQRWL